MDKYLPSDTTMNSPPMPRLLIAILLLISAVGCQQRTSSKLQGRWAGRPDSAASLARREAEKYGELPEKSSPKGSATKTDTPPQLTDWENYDVTILLDFLSSDRIEMSLDGEQAKSGTWEIISTSPAGCTIEVQTKQESDTKNNPEETTRERRQFELLLDERDGKCVGFLLTEVGADRLQGALYFQRPGKTAVD